MPFGKDLSHLIEEQISKAVQYTSTATNVTGTASQSGADNGRIAQLEANLQRLTEQFTNFLISQKKSKRNVIDYGLNVIALHGLRLAVTSGRAIFIDQEEPLDMPYTYLQLASAGSARQIRYIYLDSAGVVLETTTDPTNIGTGYLPLAMVDVWSGTSEITQDKITDLRPRAGADEKSDTATNYQLTGNATLYSLDTGNDSFVVSATNPAGLQVNITSGRALVDGEVLNAEGGLLDLTNHRNVDKEFISFSDGVKKTYDLYHQSVENVVVYVEGVATDVEVGAANGSITFAEAPAVTARIEVSYTFSGNYMLLFLVEKAKTSDGKSFGLIGWKVGSNRSPSEPPKLTTGQHAIAKVGDKNNSSVNMSSSITAITDAIIDNSYEVKNLTQYDLQYGGKLDGSSLKAEAITGDKIAANTITGDHIIAGSIESTSIKTGTITADRLSVPAITSKGEIAANAIRANMIDTGAITATKFESSTWGDMSQAMRFVKTILGGEQSWRRVLSQTDLNIGEKYQVTVTSQSYPAIRLEPERHWDGTSTWDTGNWDIPVYTSGHWVSASMDYGTNANLQAEFWGIPVNHDSTAVNITVKAKYCQDNLYTRPAGVDEWQDYEDDLNQSYCETLSLKTAAGYYYWVGSLRAFRYFKFKVIFQTSDTNKYTLLAHPEVRAANCQIGAEDMAPGALGNSISMISGTITNGGTLPLPSGYTANQCKWIVRHDRCLHSNTASTTGIPAEVTVNPSTLVVNSYWRDSGGNSAQTSCQSSGTIYYLVIGIK